MKTISLDLKQTILDKLRKEIPSIFTEDKIDFDRLRIEVGEQEFTQNEHYELNWAGKSEARKEVQKQTTATLVPLEVSSNQQKSSDNMFIEGESLEVLRILQRSYFNKIKMIYLDPPYNTGNDFFIYPDDYAERLSEYNKKAGITDKNGYLNKQDLWKKNTKENGHFHSVWLSMMYPRLYLARNLLSEDGVIFISIDDNEMANLKQICDEIFWEDNFAGDIIWNSTKSVTNTALISVSHTHNLCYFKNKEYFVKNRAEFRFPETGEGFSNPDNDARGPWKADPFQVGGWRPNQQYEIKNPKTGRVYKPNQGCSWKNDFNVFQQLLADDRIVFGVNGEAGPQRKRFLSEAEDRGRVSKTIWDDVDTTANATKALKDLMGVPGLFDNPKPCDLIKRFMQLGTAPNKKHIVLDFFAGSGTTGQAVFEQNIEDGGNRRFILVQLPEKTLEGSPAYNAGYKTISEVARARLDKFLSNHQKTNSEEIQLGARPNLSYSCYSLSDSMFKVWNQNLEDKEEISQILNDHIVSTVIDYKPEHLISELLLQHGIDLQAKLDRSMGFYKYDNNLWICIEELTSEMINLVKEQKPKKLVLLNSCFVSDELLSNFNLDVVSNTEIEIL